MLECVIIDDDSVGLYHLVTVYRLTSAVAPPNEEHDEEEGLVAMEEAVRRRGRRLW